MIDPPREESVEAVQEGKRSRYKNRIMITGDHKITATSNSKEQ